MSLVCASPSIPGVGFHLVFCQTAYFHNCSYVSERFEKHKNVWERRLEKGGESMIKYEPVWETARKMYEKVRRNMRNPLVLWEFEFLRPHRHAFTTHNHNFRRATRRGTHRNASACVHVCGWGAFYQNGIKQKQQLLRSLSHRTGLTTYNIHVEIEMPSRPC